MIKITVKGQVYAFDNDHYPLTEAIELETALGMPFGEWQEALFRGGAKAAAGLAWLVLKRAGEAVPLADILSGEYEMYTTDIRAEPEGTPGDPTAHPAASAGVSGNGSAPSPSTTGTPPPTSAASAQTSSTT